MSEPKRFSMMWGEDEDGCIYISPFEHLHGDWVRHADYAKLRMERIHDLNQIGGLQEEVANLKADADRFKAQVERLTAFTTRTIIPNEELKAQVDRLTKAGDNLEQVLTNKVASYESGNASHEWLAAKVGKPSV